jgi:Fur family transcriptional regulator, zinc uptake regulator
MSRAGHACTHPHHHVHDAVAYVAAVKAACLQQGLRLTPIRTQVLALIADSGKPVKAYDLLERMRSEVGANAPPTVYRALDFLLHHGFIHKLASINAYVACHHPSVQHTVPFLICDACQSALELEDESIAEALVAKAHVLGFVPRAQVLEVHGLCRRCSAKAAP